MNGKEAKGKAGGPLQGIRVLDFSRLYPGPLGTMLLAASRFRKKMA